MYASPKNADDESNICIVEPLLTLSDVLCVCKYTRIEHTHTHMQAYEKLTIRARIHNHNLHFNIKQTIFTSPFWQANWSGMSDS